MKALYTDRMAMHYIEHVTKSIQPAIYRALHALRQGGEIDDMGNYALLTLAIDVAEYCAENTAPVDTTPALCPHCARAGQWIFNIAYTSRLPEYSAREWGALIDQTVKMYTAI